MDVAQGVNKFFMISDVVVVIASFPEGFRSFCAPARNCLLETLNRRRNGLTVGFAHQQVDMLGHDYVAVYPELIEPAHGFEDGFKYAL